MNIYDNGIEADKRDLIDQGFLIALVDDAERKLKDEYPPHRIHKS